MADTAVASFRQGALISMFPVEKMAPARSADAMTGAGGAGIHKSAVQICV